MALYIKLEVCEDGKVYAFQSESGLWYAPSVIWGYSPREALLKLADKMRREQERGDDPCQS